MTIISIDPGGTTGIAIRMPDNTINTMALASSRGSITAAEELWELVPSATQIVIERFATSGLISRYGLATVELVGGVKALCHHLKIPLAVRMPQQRRAFQHLAYSSLSQLGLKRSDTGNAGTFTVHEEDALAHLLAWEYSTRS